jgi:predicted permease
VDDEIRFHIAMQTEALIRQGLSPGRARAKAASDFGTTVTTEDGVRVARGLTPSRMLDTFLRDLRFAARSLARTPGFTLVAILTLALGIGATTAVFSVVNGVLLQPLPYPQPERIVSLYEAGRLEGKSSRGAVSAPNFADWRAQAKTVELMTALRGGPTTVLGFSEPRRVNLYAVSRDYFALFGGRALAGRTFTADEHTPSGPGAAIVSERVWREAMNGRADFTNVQLQAWGSSYTVVGVMPDGFGFPEQIDMWIPLEPQNVGMGRGSHNDETYARLAPGVSLAQAQAELEGIAERLKITYPDNNGAYGAVVVNVHDDLVGPVKLYLRLLLGAVVLVLLVACVNLASANLARATGRTREMTIRTALGAGRGRLVSQLLTENVVLAIGGGSAGVLLAFWLVRTLVALGPRTLPRATAVGIDGTVLLFALGVSIATGVLIGVLPALQGARSSLAAGLRAGDRNAASGRAGVRGALVAIEVALALVLLVGSGLLIRSFRTLLAQDTGFDATGVLAVRVSLPESRYSSGDRISAYYTAALGAVRAVPGVIDAGMINIAPLSRGGFGSGMGIEGQERSLYADYRIVSPSYFSTMHIPIVRGRAFTDADDSTSTHLVVLNEAAAKKFFPGENPVGKRVRSLGMDRHRDVWLTVVGVARDVRSRSLSAPADPQAFVSYRQRPERGTFGVLMLRTNLPPASVASVVRSSLKLVDANVLTEIETLDDIRMRSVGDRRFTMLVLTGFAALGLVLAAIGIYGVLSYSVSRRTREIGVRMALGAAPRSVVRMVVGESMGPVLAGAAIGFVAALAATRLLHALLFEVSATDPFTFMAVTAVLLAVAVLASVLPAWRASRVDPLTALRSE